MTNKTPSRRHFLKGSLLATGGLLLLHPIYGASSSLLDDPEGFNNSAFCDSRHSVFGKGIEISGRIYDSTGRIPQAGVLLEYWHISPGTQQKRHKGQLVTDAHGYYRIKSDFPGREMGRHATLHFKLTDGSKKQNACLKVSGTGAFITDEHWANHRHLPDHLLFPKWDKENTDTIEFNFSL